MLGIMRRRKGFVRIILTVVVVSVAASFAFALYGIWGGALSGESQGDPAWIASVDGERVATRQFYQRRSAIERDLRDRFGGQGIDEQTIASFADQQALGSIVGLYLAEAEAERVGLRVTPEEVSDFIVNSPSFQRGGRFVGADMYRKILGSYRMDVAEFEREQAREIAADKLKAAIFGVARVSDADVEKRYHDEVERVDVDYVLLADSAYAAAEAPSAAEVRRHYDANASRYRTPEARRAAYVLFDREARAASADVQEPEIAAYYEKNKAALYAHPEERRASHVLVKLPPGGTPEQDAEARAKAEEALSRIRAGGDFAEEAQRTSQDEGTAASGGDLGWFGRERMVKEFEDVVFSLPVGGVSDAFKSPFGYHVVKVTDSRPEGTKPLEEVREEIRRTLALQKAQEQIRAAADDFVKRLASQEASFEKTAAAAGLTPLDTGFFARGEAAGSLGRIPQVEEAVFSLAVGAASQAVAVPQGLAVLSLAEIRPPAPAPFESVRAQVEEDLKKSRSREKARAVAAQITAASGDLGARAEKHKLEVKSYPAVNRIQPLPPLTDASKSAAFAAAVGSVLGPFESGEGLVVLEVKGRTPSSPEQETAERRSLRRRLLDEERSSLYNAFLARLQKSAQIDVNEPLLREGRRGG